MDEKFEVHRTTDYLTKFEFARLLGLRMLQLGAEASNAEEPRLVALRELRDGGNPAILRRKLPNGSHEDRAVRDLKLPQTLLRLCREATAMPEG